MELDRYPYSRYKGEYEYEFFSHGEHGRIRKLVRFTFRVSNGTKFYNLGFGDASARYTFIDDKVVSNNGDALKVINTVAAIAIDFTNQFPDALIFAVGSTSARTRLYQMGLNRNWKEIEPIFEMWGQRDDGSWESFQKGISYKGFLARRKF